VKKRIQFDVDPEELKRIDADKKKANLATRAELFRRAIALYRMSVNADKVIIEKDGKRERIIP
jgi:hypothetical protein